MDGISISQLKINPSGAIALASDYPMAIKNKGQTTAYLIGSDLFGKMANYLEDLIDKNAVATTSFKDASNFEDVARELGI